MKPIQVSREALIKGYRSGLEMANAEWLEEQGVSFEYEAYPLFYTVPARKARYTVDFVLLDNGIMVETKGRFTTDDRKKHKLIKAEYPDLDLRIVFANPNAKIGKKSKTTYAMWCERESIMYAAKLIPLEWIKEPPNKKRWYALNKAIGQNLMET